MSDTTTPPPVEGRPLPPRGPRPWAWVLVGLVFVVAGAGFGAGATLLVLKSRLVKPPSPGERTAEIIASDLQNRYGLTAEQAGKVKEIMARRMASLEMIRREANVKMTAEHENLRAEMKAVLSREQFERWAARFDSLRPPPFGPPAGPGRPPGPGNPPRPGALPPTDGFGPEPGRGPGPVRPPLREGPPFGRRPPPPPPGAPPGAERPPEGPPGGLPEPAPR